MIHDAITNCIIAFKIPQHISKYLSDPVFFIDTTEIFFFEMNFELQGVRGQTVLFNLTLRERNIQVRLYLKTV